MKYARFEINKDNWEAREKSVAIGIQSVYRNVEDAVVYAPKSRIIFEKEIKHEYTLPTIQILIPVWVFTRNGYKVTNAYGFVELTEK